MPTWDEITPFTERKTRAHKLTATNVLIGLNFLGFLVSGILTYSLKKSGTGLAVLTALRFDAFHAIGRGWVWQFVTYSLIQIVDVWNMFWFLLAAYLLYQFGNDLEEELGSRRYALFYFACAAYGALAHAIFQYAEPSPADAASFFAPVFAVTWAYALRNPSRPVLFCFLIPMRLIVMMLLVSLITAFYCVVYFKAGFSHFTVIGATLAAIAIHQAEPLIDRWLDSRRARSERLRFLEEVELRREVDAILEKITRQGMASLTGHERRILKRASALMSRVGDSAE